MEERIDIHNYQARLDNAIKLLEQSKEISDANKKAIKEFLEHCSGHVGVPRLAKYAYTMTNIAKWMKKDFKKATERDLTTLVSGIVLGKFRKKGGQKFSENSIEDYKKACKKFWKALGKKNIVEFIKFKPVKTYVRDNDIWSDEEVDRLLHFTKDIQDLAWISVLTETGCRIGELGNCRINHLTMKDDGFFRIILNGKSGEGVPVTLFTSTAAVANWLNAHPDNKPDSPLWVIHRKETFVENGQKIKKPVIRPMTYGGFKKRLYDICELAGIKGKKFNSHIHRHNIITKYLRSGCNTEVLKKRMRLSPTSRVLSTTYAHIINADVEEMDRVFHGIKDTSVKKKPKEELKKCPKCKLMQKPQDYCSRCGSPISIEIALKMEEKKANEQKMTIEKMIKEGMQSELERMAKVTAQVRFEEGKKATTVP